MIESVITVKPFRFWCQKVLPLVYDDSLSYYELLCKVVDYINGLLEDDDNVIALVNQLEAFTTNYFNNLDVQEEINNKLDVMVENGQLDEVISHYVDPYIAAQNTRITNFETTVNGHLAGQDSDIDVLEARMDTFASLPTGSLSTDADAELVDIRVGADGTTYSSAGNAVRAQVSELKTKLNGMASGLATSEDLTGAIFRGGYITLAGQVGNIIDVTDVTESTTRGYIVTPCKAGDSFKLTGTGGADPRLWGFLDNEYRCLSIADEYATASDLELNAVVDGYLVVNVYLSTSAPYSLTHYFYTLENIYDELNLKMNASAFKYGYAFDLNNPLLWEQGSISTSNGENIVSQTRIRTKDFIDPSIEKIVTVSGYLNMYIYNSDGTYNTFSGWRREYSDFDSTKKYRVIFSTVAGSSGAGNVNPADDWDNFIFLKTELSSLKYRKKIAWAGSIPFEWYSGKGSDYSLFTRETTYADFISAFNTLVANSNYVTASSIGAASDGQMMYKYELIPEMYRNITINDYNRPPKVIIVSGQHGFEKSSCYGLYYLVRDLLNNYADSEALTWIRSNLHLIIIPVANPYGFNNLTRKNYNGVDLNRNWNPGWEASDPEDSDYGGAAAFDQPETQNIKAVIDSNTDAFYLIDFHTNGMGRAEAWNKVNWSVFNTDVFEDDYYISAYYAVNTHITQVTENMIHEYNLDSSGQPLGSVETNLRGATVSAYAKSVKVMANTFEGFNGFPSEASPYSANEQKANSELIGNWIKTLLATFRALN